jgi:hypothetical protein
VFEAAGKAKPFRTFMGQSQKGIKMSKVEYFALTYVRAYATGAAKPPELPD